MSPVRRDVTWWAGLAVAAAAAAATAHGLYAVAEASGVPWAMALLYPVMTDGLALVAYSATNRLTAGARRYAWVVVVTAAGLSGAAQAMYLVGGGLSDASDAVRFGIGAAPALAAAAVAHLLHLIRTTGPAEQAEIVRPAAVRPPAPVVQNRAAAVDRTPRPAPSRPGTGPAERARSAALRHRTQQGQLPTTSALVRLADVSRGTAGTVLRGLRPTRPAPLEPDSTQPASDDHPAHPQSKIQNDHTPMHHDPEEDQLRGAGR